MKDIRIDFTQSEPCPDSKQLGEYGEKGVERFAITPPADMSENPEVLNYVVAFLTARGPLRLGPFEKSDIIYIAVEDACVGGVPVSVQLEGHNAADTLVIKTPVIEGFSFAKSVPEGSIRFVNSSVSANHFHANLDVLGRLSEENGSLVFDGKTIGAKTYKTVELTYESGDAQAFTDYAVTGSVHFVATDKIPDGAEILKVEVKFDYDGLRDEWFDLNGAFMPGDNYIPVITATDRAFYLESLGGVCVCVRYYINEMYDDIYEAAHTYAPFLMRITYAEEGGAE